jgi:hypothetical protein
MKMVGLGTSPLSAEKWRTLEAENAAMPKFAAIDVGSNASRPERLELLLAAPDRLYGKYLLGRNRCQAAFSAESVHDLRIAVRRMLALVERLQAIEPQPRLKKLRRDFKAQLDSLDDLRDTQVLLAELAALQKSL